MHSLEPPIIYHDLKPGNIILKMPERNLKLIDFGEARRCINGNAPGAGKTKEYAAPEQQTETKGKTDQRTDIYCFGTTLYRLLTGQFVPAYPQPVDEIRERFPELHVSKGMDNIIQKCTQQRPEDRFQSAQELMQALENISLWDDDYLKKQTRKIKAVAATFIASIALVVVGFGFMQGAAYVDSQTYESLVATEAAVGYETRVNNYMTAIELNDKDPRAYMRLVEAYQQNGLFGDEQSQQLGSAYNAGKAGFDMSDPAMVELNYQIGHLYFTMYSGEDNSFRARIQKAQGYFAYVVEYGQLSDEHYKIACSYNTLCDFFINFVLNDVSIQEPTQRDYQNMLDAIDACMEDMQNYDQSDAAYTRLTLYQKIMDTINANVRGLAQNELPQEQVEDMVQRVCEATQTESVTQPISMQLQSKILEQSEVVYDNIVREYNSLRRGD